MKRVLLSLAMIAALVAIASPARAEPTKAAVGFYVMAVRNVDLRAETFFADFYLWLRFVADDDKAREITDKLEIMNGRPDAMEEVERKKVGDETYVCWRVIGTFHFTPTLAGFPFDSQRLVLEIENSMLESGDLLFVDDEASYARADKPKELAGVRGDLALVESRLRGVERFASETVYRSDFGDPSRPQAESRYSRFTLSMRFERDAWPLVLRVLLPLAVILAVAYLVFFIPPRDFGAASAIAVTALLACVAFNVTVTRRMPLSAGLVLTDEMFVVSYALLFAALAWSVGGRALHDRGDDARAERLQHVARWVFPLLAAAVLALLIAMARRAALHA